MNAEKYLLFSKNPRNFAMLYYVLDFDINLSEYLVKIALLFTKDNRDMKAIH